MFHRAAFNRPCILFSRGILNHMVQYQPQIDTSFAAISDATHDAAPAAAILCGLAALVVTAHIGLRDALLSLAVGHELPAGRLWTQIAAQHRGRTRAELLTIRASTGGGSGPERRGKRRD